MLPNFRLKGFLFAAPDDLSAELSAALENAKNHCLVLAARSCNFQSALVSVHVPSFAADEGFAGFDFPGQHLFERSFVESETNPMIHEPRGLLGDAKIAMHFVAADSVLAIHDEPHGRKPLVQAERRILKDGSGFEAGAWTIMLRIALPDASVGEISDVLGTAMRTPHLTIGPAEFHHESFAVFVIREVDDCFLKCAGRFHDSSMPELPW